MLETYCTTAEAAKILDCTEGNVLWLIHHKHLDARRWLRAWMIDRGSVEKWRQKRRIRRK